MSQQPINVPLLDLAVQYQPIRGEIDAAINSIFDKTAFVLGPTVANFEEQLARYVGADHAIGCASGGDALLLMLMAEDIGPGDEVICPTFTFFATAGTIARTGAKPVFCDIDSVTYNMSVDSLRETAAKCENLKAIMPVHLYGQSADMAGIQQVADEYHVPVLEDAAQAIGTCDVDGNRVGSKSRVHGWSFYPTKNLGAAGDAGIVTTNNADLAEKIRRLRVHGGKDRYYHDMIGMNSRLDALQAAVLSVKLPHLDGWNEKRRSHAAFYDTAFEQAGATSSATPLSNDSFLPLRFPHVVSEREHHIYHQYVIRVPAEVRDELRDALRDALIGNEVFYPLPLHMQECFAYLGQAEGSCPIAEAVAKEVLALPIYPELSQDQLQHVASTIARFVESRADATAKQVSI